MTNGSHSEATVVKSGRMIVLLLCVITVGAVLLYGAVDSGTLSLLALPSVAIVFVWGWNAFRSKHMTVRSPVLVVPLLALALIGLVQLLPIRGPTFPPDIISVSLASSLSFDPYATRFFIMRLVFYLIFFAAALTFVNSRSRLRTVVFLLITFGALLAFYSILQRVEQPSAIYGLRAPTQAIPFGTYVNRHHFAALMEMTLGVTLGLLFGGGLKRNRWPFLIAGGCVMAISIFLTGSRGGMLGVIGVLGLIVTVQTTVKHRPNADESVGRPAMRSRLAIVFGCLAFFLLSGGLMLFIGGGDLMLRGAGLAPGAGDFSSGRIQFWQTAWKIFLDHPLIGAGLDAFGTAYSFYDPSSGLFRVEQAHNDYLQTLSDSGIIGFACVVIFIYLLFREGITTIRHSRISFRRGAAIGALAGCFGILVHSFFDFPLRTPANAFVFLALATIATVRIPESDPNRHRSR